MSRSGHESGRCAPETPSPKKKSRGGFAMLRYGMIAWDLSCPYPLRGRKILNGAPTGEKTGALPGGMTILDVPRTVLLNFNRIGYDFYIVCVVTDEIGENGADERLHPTAQLAGSAFQ